MVDEEAIEDEVRRRLAIERRELEREFDDRRRTAKVQETHLRDRLRQDQVEWEARRRDQAKRLADQQESLRRQLEAARNQTLQREKARAELGAAKSAVEESRTVEHAERRALITQVAERDRQLAAARRDVRRVGIAALVVSISLVAAAWALDRNAWGLTAGASGALVAAAYLWKVRR